MSRSGRHPGHASPPSSHRIPPARETFRGQRLLSKTRYLGGYPAGMPTSGKKAVQTLRLGPDGVRLEGAFKKLFTIPWTSVKEIALEDAGISQRPEVIGHSEELPEPTLLVVRMGSGEALFAVRRQPADLATKLEDLNRRLQAGRQRAALTAGSSGPDTGRLGVADELAKLARLRDDGTITHAEFESQKAKLLG